MKQVKVVHKVFGERVFTSFLHKNSVVVYSVCTTSFNHFQKSWDYLLMFRQLMLSSSFKVLEGKTGISSFSLHRKVSSTPRYKLSSMTSNQVKANTIKPEIN